MGNIGEVELACGRFTFSAGDHRAPDLGSHLLVESQGEEVGQLPGRDATRGA